MQGVRFITIDDRQELVPTMYVKVIDYLLRKIEKHPDDQSCYFDELYDKHRYHDGNDLFGGPHATILDALITLKKCGVIDWINAPKIIFNPVLLAWMVLACCLKHFVFVQRTMLCEETTYGEFELVRGSQNEHLTDAEQDGHSQRATYFRIRDTHAKGLELAMTTNKKSYKKPPYKRQRE